MDYLKKDALIREQYYIRKYHSDNSDFGYNITLGGNIHTKHPVVEISRLGKTITNIYNSPNEIKTKLGYPSHIIRSICEENKDNEDYKSCIQYPFINSLFFTKKTDCRIYKYLDDIDISKFNLSKQAKQMFKTLNLN